MTNKERLNLDGATCDICSGTFSTAEIVECVACGREVCQWCSEEGLCEECACNLGECPHDEEDEYKTKCTEEFKREIEK